MKTKIQANIRIVKRISQVKSFIFQTFIPLWAYYALMVEILYLWVLQEIKMIEENRAKA